MLDIVLKEKMFFLIILYNVNALHISHKYYVCKEIGYFIISKNYYEQKR